jgi:hypothetical protein
VFDSASRKLEVKKLLNEERMDSERGRDEEMKMR